jgi:methionyl-tRNA formyltransferase
MVKKMDAGDFCAQRGVLFSEKMNFEEIEKILASLAADLIVEVLPKIFDQTISFYPQDESEVTFAPKILSEDLVINWERPARSILNQIRAFSPHPGAQCMIQIKGQKKSLKILSASISSHKAAPRELVILGKSNYVVGCIENSLQIHDVKLEGKSTTTFDALIRGYPHLQFI